MYTDCIRTYTWDKKLESWIKDRGKNKPTITSPKDYRNRFRVSMMQYVLQAPNVWHGFLNQLPSTVAAMHGTAGRTTKMIDDAVGNGSAAGVTDLSNVEGALGRGFDNSESTVGLVRGKKEGANEEERLSAEGHLMNEATIREMSTMTFA